MPVEPTSNDIAQQIEYLWALKSSITCSDTVPVIVSLLESPLENLERWGSPLHVCLFIFSLGIWFGSFLLVPWFYTSYVKQLVEPLWLGILIMEKFISWWWMVPSIFSLYSTTCFLYFIKLMSDRACIDKEMNGSFCSGLTKLEFWFVKMRILLLSLL